jgi:hypothetical protein
MVNAHILHKQQKKIPHKLLSKSAGQHGERNSKTGISVDILIAKVILCHNMVLGTQSCYSS